jgi:hypothetical protein
VTVNPLLATVDFLIEGRVTKAVTTDKNIGLDIKTCPYNSLS